MAKTKFEKGLEKSNIGRFFQWARYVAIAFFIISVVLTFIGGLHAASVVGEVLGSATCDIPSRFVCNLFVNLGFPEAILDSNYIIWYFFVPMAAIILAVYHFVKHAFDRNIAILLSVLVGLASIPSGVIMAIDAVLLAALGQYAFAGMILIAALHVGEGIAMGWEAGAVRKYQQYLTGLDKQEESLAKQEAAILKRMSDPNVRLTGPVHAQLNEQLAKIQGERKSIARKRALAAEYGIS